MASKTQKLLDYLDVLKMTSTCPYRNEDKRFNRADYRSTGGHYLGDRSLL